ncbi:MAG: hypothetical protein P4L33_18200 [Capsulimonadaceae bacterium]|nr:hypothetical protein [Capsulimonadaceae bacterium]
MRNPFSSRIRVGDDGCAALLLAGVTVAVFWPWLFTGRAFYWGDIGLYFAPLTVFLRANLLHGDIPFWNPELLCGTPFVGNPQAWPFSPVSALLPFLEPHRFLMVMNVISIFLAGLFCYRYLTRSKLRLGWVSGVLGALVYMLGGFVVSKAQFPNMLAALSFLPLCLLQAERLVRTPSLRQAAWLGLALGLQMLSAHAQISMMTIYLCGVVALASGKWWRKSARALAGRLGLFLAAGGVAAALSASEWLPTVALWHSAGRHVLGLKIANRFFLHLDQWTGFFWPNRFGHPIFGNFSPDGAVVTYHNYWETACYIGIVPSLLVLFAPFILARRGRPFRFWPIVIAAAAVCALVTFVPTAWFARNVFYGGVSMRSLHSAVALIRGIGAGLIVAGGVAPLVLTNRSRIARYAFFWGAVSVVSVWLAFGKAAWLYHGAFYVLPGVRAFHDPARFLTGAALGAAVLSAMVLDRILFRPKKRQTLALCFAFACIVVTVVDLGAFDRGIYPLKSIDEINSSLRKSVLVRSLHNDPILEGRKGRILMVDSEGPWNFFTSYRNYRQNEKSYLVRWADTSVPNLLMGTGLMEAGAYEPLAPAMAQRRAYSVRHSTPFLADDAGRMAVEQVIAFRPHPLPQQPELLRLKAFQTRDNYDSIYYYKNLRFEPRVRFVNARTERLVAYPQSAEPAIARERPNLLVVSIPPSNKARTLMISDSFFPGWHAKMRGKPVQIVDTFDGFRKLRIPATRIRSSVVLTYRPVVILLGIYLMLAGVALLTMTLGAWIASSASRTGEPRIRRQQGEGGWLFPDVGTADGAPDEKLPEPLPERVPVAAGADSAHQTITASRDEEGFVEWHPGDLVEVDPAEPQASSREHQPASAGNDRRRFRRLNRERRNSDGF